MTAVKVAIIYYSATGTLHSMAQQVAAAAEKTGAEVRLRQVQELAPHEAIASNVGWSQHIDRTKHEPKATIDDVGWADVVLFGTPARYGNVAGTFKMFLDSLSPLWNKGLLANKVYAGFTASQTPHGGQEAALLALYNSIYHFGGLIVPPGYTDPIKFREGNPYGVSHTNGLGNDVPINDDEIAALDHLASRTVAIAGQLIAGRSAGA
jgi:NAD(P)H dehydrogenase (quinone)